MNWFFPKIPTDSLDQFAGKTYNHSRWPFFLDATKGTGKSPLTGVIQLFINFKEKYVFVGASSAIAAQFLGGDSPAHLGSKVSFSNYLESTCIKDVDSQRAQDFQETHLTNFDYIMMTHRQN